MDTVFMYYLSFFVFIFSGKKMRNFDATLAECVLICIFQCQLEVFTDFVTCPQDVLMKTCVMFEMVFFLKSCLGVLEVPDRILVGLHILPIV